MSALDKVIRDCRNNDLLTPTLLGLAEKELAALREAVDAARVALRAIYKRKGLVLSGDEWDKLETALAKLGPK